MKKNKLWWLGFLSFSLSLVFVAGCFSSDSNAELGGDATAGDVPEGLGAAIGAVFSGGSGEASTLRPRRRNVEGENSTCTDVEGSGPEGITNSATVTAGTYGAGDDTVTITAANGCDQDPENGYASFTLTSDVETSCGVEMLSGSTGIFINTSECEPSIWASWDLETEDGTLIEGVDCYLCIEAGSVGTIASATCEYEGTSVSIDMETACEVLVDDEDEAGDDETATEEGDEED